MNNQTHTFTPIQTLQLALLRYGANPTLQNAHEVREALEARREELEVQALACMMQEI